VSGTEGNIRSSIEAILIVSEEPVSPVVLATVLGVPTESVESVLRELSAEYAQSARGFELRETASGWRYYSHPNAHEIVVKFMTEGSQARLTQAALETLSVVAYRQPISRGRISAIRGVNVDAVMRTLLTRGLVEEAGVEHETQAILYKTTSYFLERLGLRSLEELPPLAPHMPDIDAVDDILDSLSS
jgi:segregation and condensation protein B